MGVLEEKDFTKAPITNMDKFSQTGDRIYLKSEMFIEDAYILTFFSGNTKEWKNQESFLRFIHLKSTQNYSEREGIMIIIDNYGK